ncbi:MAG: coproporphyrinogen III oxidase family protein [Gemmataceae bacterium]|nr:coproporphyrinogen III oxidase family protein [Gemmataceae bacterium]MDW8266280.1 coproporphyrinogen-III oxidase family protein [Gemmataceae bacterium]
MTQSVQEQTGLGNYFVANYPPFAYWKPEHVPAARAALAQPPEPGTPLGLYLHIPFCRKRCKFCYFRVYTDKNARDVETYLDALAREVEFYSQQPVVGGRSLQFVYFGGGTPSYLSVAQLRGLVSRLKSAFSWADAAEVTFECEPGTLQRPKLEALKELGITRLSLGIENFNDKILEANGRAHLSAEIFRAYAWAQEIGFPQINIDLIAGMVGESWDNWREVVRRTIELSPDSVTIYQMELPFNTVFSRELRTLGPEEPRPFPIADWPTKRAWVDYAFDQLGQAGYTLSSAYTLVKDPRRGRFVYRDSLWHGADMFGTGVASFGHIRGVHVQNVDTWEEYLTRIQRGEFPFGRALPVQSRQRLIREMILQLKTGAIDVGYFQEKFEENVLALFENAFRELADLGLLRRHNGRIELTRQGLLQVDRLLPNFFEPDFRGPRYT